MIRILSSLLLAIVLALTSQSMAVARGASAATGKMVLCTGGGLVTVYVDASGQPTSAPHICPDAALNVLLDQVITRPQVFWTLVAVATTPVAATKILPSLPRMSAYQRAPPLMV